MSVPLGAKVGGLLPASPVGRIFRFWHQLGTSKRRLIALGMVLVVGIFSLAGFLRAASATVRQEINIVDKTYTATNAIISSDERVQLDTTQYSGTKTYYFEVVGSASAGSSGSIRLRRVGTTTDDATFTTSNLGTAATRFRSSSFSPPGGATEYFVYVDAAGASNTVTIKAARIIVTHSADPLTATETQIEIGNNETGKTNTTAAALTNPKYWKYNSANWSPAPSFYAEATYKKTDTGTLIPTVYAVGAVDNGLAAVSPGLPAGTQVDDLLVMFCETNNQAITATGWTEASNSPQSDATDVTRLTVLWRRATGSDATTTNDSGDHQVCRIVGVRGVVATGDPWDITAGGAETTSDTSGSIPGATTTVANTLVLAAASTGRDGNSTAEFSGWTNADLSSVTEHVDNTVNTGAGGGIGVASGGKAAAGTYGATTVTYVTATRKGLWSGALTPAIDTSPTVTIKLQEDNGSFGSWTDVTNGTIVNASSTSGAVTRIRTGTAFTPVDGRNYRLVGSITNGTGHTYDIYNAKIVAVQSSSITKLEPQYLLLNTADSNVTGLQGYQTLWNSGEWANSANIYKFAIDSDNASNSAKLQDISNGNADVSGATATGANQQVSAGFSMPASGNQVDVNVTNTTGVVAAVRILVEVTINSPPASPTLSAPANSATGVSTTPTFQLRTTDANDDYLRYKIEVCSNSDCSTVLRTIDQTASQTGWTGQDTQTNTAYVGNSVITSSTMASHTYQAPPLSAGTQYWWRAYAIDPGGNNAFSGASGINTFTTNAIPAAPTLNLPANAATSVSTTPQFQFRTTDADNNYLRYKIEVCSNSDCSTVLRTIDQTASQTGWTGQDTQTSTAYVGNSVITSSTMASHTYPAPPLSAGTQYWWRAYAIDPGGNNTFSGASGIFSFTTASVAAGGTSIQGGTNIRGGTKLGN